MFQQNNLDDNIDFECSRHNLINKYRLMKCPFQKQNLQLLYPGRFLSQEYEASGYNIPHENEVELDKTRKMSSSLKQAYSMENEALSRHLGGKYKIFPFPAVEPEAIIDDPRLKGLNTEIFKEKVKTTQFEDSENPINNVYNDLNQVILDRNNIIDEARGNDSITTYQDILDDNEKLPRYDWQDVVEKEYPKILEKNISKEIPNFKNIENYENVNLDERSGSNISSQNNNTIKYISLSSIVVIIILLILVVCVCIKK